MREDSFRRPGNACSLCNDEQSWSGGGVQVDFARFMYGSVDDSPSSADSLSDLGKVAL